MKQFIPTYIVHAPKIEFFHFDSLQYFNSKYEFFPFELNMFHSKVWNLLQIYQCREAMLVTRKMQLNKQIA